MLSRDWTENDKFWQACIGPVIRIYMKMLLIIESENYHSFSTNALEIQ